MPNSDSASVEAPPDYPGHGPGGGGGGGGPGPWSGRPGNQPIQSGYGIFPFADASPPTYIEPLDNPLRSGLAQEGLAVPAEPPGFVGQMGLRFGEGLRSGAQDSAQELGQRAAAAAMG